MLIALFALATTTTLDKFYASDRAYSQCIERQARTIDNKRDTAADIVEAAIELCGAPQMRLWQAAYDLNVDSGSEYPRKETNEFMEKRYDDLRRQVIARILSARSKQNRR